MKEIKILQLDITQQLRFVLPQDYVNWVRISNLETDVYILYQKIFKLIGLQLILQDNNSNILFDQNGNVLRPTRF